jgi:hypothetical protein
LTCEILPVPPWTFSHIFPYEIRFWMSTHFALTPKFNPDLTTSQFKT